MNTAKLIEGMIPDELRLASHPDAALVNEALATAITAMNESDSISLAGMRADVRKALTAYFGGTFSKHISEEDEAWGAMKAKVESAPPTARITYSFKRRNGEIIFQFEGAPFNGNGVVQKDANGVFVADMIEVGTGNNFSGTGATPNEAARNAFHAQGVMLLGEVVKEESAPEPTA